MAKNQIKNLTASIGAFFSTFFTPATTIDGSHAATVKALNLLSRVFILVGAFSNYTFIIHTCGGFFYELVGGALCFNSILAHVVFVLCVMCIDLCMGVFAHHATLSIATATKTGSPSLAITGIILGVIAGAQCYTSMHFSSVGNSAVIAEKYEDKAPDNHAATLHRIDSTRRAAIEGIQKNYADRMKDASAKDAAEIKRLTEQAAAITKAADLRIRQKLTGYMGTQWGASEYTKAMEKYRNDSTKIMAQYHPTASNIAFQMNSDLEATRANFAAQEQTEKDEHYRKSENHRSTLEGVKLIFAKFTAWSSTAALLVIVLLVLMCFDFQRVSAVVTTKLRVKRNTSNKRLSDIRKDCHTYFDRLCDYLDNGNNDSAKDAAAKVLQLLDDALNHPVHKDEKEAKEYVDGLMIRLSTKAQARGSDMTSVVKIEQIANS